MGARGRQPGAPATCAGCGVPYDEWTRGCHNCDSRHHMRRTLERRRLAVRPAPLLVGRDELLPPGVPREFARRVRLELRIAERRALEIVADATSEARARGPRNDLVSVAA